MGESANSTAQPVTQLRSRPKVAGIIIFGGLIALVLAFIVSVSLGAANIKFLTVWEAVFRFNPDLTQHQIIRELRLPRVVMGGLVGAAFATSGAIMQGMTRNPLADPGLLGINAGAGFALALCFAFFPGMSFNQLVFMSFLGAAGGAILVFGIGSATRGGMSPARLALAGAAVVALLNAISEGIALRYRIGQELAFWYAGGVAGAKWGQLAYMWPWIAIGIVGALVISRQITMLSLGDDVAAGLGIRTGLIKIIGMVLVLMLAGSSVAAVGSISFIGLIVPHISRYLVGVHYRWIIPCSAVLGSLLLVVADIGARMVHRPYETPAAAIISIIGVPFFVFLIRRAKKEVI
ncbi:FecCD family ABC transporter permease [Cohnella fermenti]|uniref:Iron ABC transporter permease n=1 Tax=Cohnella fermenti TaxID=2565925 RepID=A0A4S4BM54_9BACL|nr:iron ABC transporter permease [Cohnella fermenti]THF75886.1 iron ABC transporter permease [Cohnella fermenti]